MFSVVINCVFLFGSGICMFLLFRCVMCSVFSESNNFWCLFSGVSCENNMQTSASGIYCCAILLGLKAVPACSVSG